MIDWADLSEWLISEHGITAAILTGAIALLVAWWQSRDVSKNRYSEEKLLAYERLIARLEVLGEFELLRAEHLRLLSKRENGEDLDASDVEAEELLDQRLKTIEEKYNHYAGQASRPRDMLLTVGAAQEAYRLMKVIEKMQAHADAGRHERCANSLCDTKSLPLSSIARCVRISAFGTERSGHGVRDREGPGA